MAPGSKQPDRPDRGGPQRPDDDERQKHGKAFEAAHAEARGQAEAGLGKELKALERTAAKYQKQLDRALAKRGGVNPQQLQADFAEIAGIEDGERRDERLRQFAADYESLLGGVMADAGIDREALQAEVLGDLQVSPGARLLRAGGDRSAIGWTTDEGAR